MFVKIIIILTVFIFLHISELLGEQVDTIPENGCVGANCPNCSPVNENLIKENVCVGANCPNCVPENEKLVENVCVGANCPNCAPENEKLVKENVCVGANCPTHAPGNENLVKENVCVGANCPNCAPENENLAKENVCVGANCPTHAPGNENLVKENVCVGANCPTCAPENENLVKENVCVGANCPNCAPENENLVKENVCVGANCPTCAPGNENLVKENVCVGANCPTCAPENENLVKEHVCVGPNCPPCSAPIAKEEGKIFESQPLDHDVCPTCSAPVAPQPDKNCPNGNGQLPAARRRKRCNENNQKACSSCSPPKVGKHRRDEENSENLCPTGAPVSRNGKIENANDRNAFRNVRSPVDKSGEKQSDTNSAPIAEKANVCPTGLSLEENGQPAKGDNRRMCPTCSALLEDGQAVCLTCYASESLQRLQREKRCSPVRFRRRLKNFGQRPQDAPKRQNRNVRGASDIKTRAKRQSFYVRPSVIKIKQVFKRETGVNAVGSQLNHDKENDLYQSFGRLQGNGDKLGYGARPRVRTHRLTGNSGLVANDGAGGIANGRQHDGSDGTTRFDHNQDAKFRPKSMQNSLKN